MDAQHNILSYDGSHENKGSNINICTEDHHKSASFFWCVAANLLLSHGAAWTQAHQIVSWAHLYVILLFHWQHFVSIILTATEDVCFLCCAHPCCVFVMMMGPKNILACWSRLFLDHLNNLLLKMDGRIVNSVKTLIKKNLIATQN